MKIISRQEATAWVNGLLGFDLTPESLEAEFQYWNAYRVPPDTGKKTALARTIASSINPSRPRLFWITSYGVWPSSENMDLFDGYRDHLGENRPLSDAPGHLFNQKELRELQTLIGISLYFFWDAVLIEGALGSVIRLTHDECMNVYAKDQDRLRAIDDLLKKIGIRRLED